MSHRILYIVDSLDRDGVASQLLVLAGALASEGWEVRVAALAVGGTMEADFRAAGVPTEALRRRWAYDPIAYGRLHRLVRRLQPEIIHTWGTAARLYGGLAARAADHSRLIVGQYAASSRRSLVSPIERRWLHRVERSVASSQLLCNGCTVADWPAQKCVVVRPGVAPVPASGASRPMLLSELALPAGAKLIGVVGRLEPQKDVKELIWAADLLRVLHDNLRLLVIGDGPLRPQLEQYARLASDLEHIRFLGERDDVWRIMPHLDVLWNADHSRGPAIAILEAMSAGVPVVASDTQFNRELVVEGETGYLIPLFERAGRAARARHTDRIFTDGALAARLADGSRRRFADHFSAERMVRQYIDVYGGAA